MDVDSPALIEAASRGDTNAIISLLDEGIDINAQDANGATALMRAVEAGQADAVKLLLDHRADVNIQGRFLGYSAIVFAVKSRNTDILEMLLDRCDAKPPDLGFATGVAQLMGNPRLSELLRQAATKWEQQA